MICFTEIFRYYRDWLRVIACFFRTRFMSDIAKDLEIIALRSQLALVYQDILNKKIPKPKTTQSFREQWFFLSKLFPNWKSTLVIVKPETVINWHKKAFRLFWFLKSKKRGRPKISRATIALIKRVHRENPLLSPEKIYERLIVLGITDAPAPKTIAKYIPKIRKSPDEKRQQSWKTFLANHRKGIWSMDFFIVPTLRFKVLLCLADRQS